MSWNNFIETKEFEKQQAQNREWYRKCGMSEEAIRKMYEYDYQVFLKDRAENRRSVDNNFEGEQREEESNGNNFYDFAETYTEELDPFLIGFEDERLNKIVSTFKKPEDVAILMLISRGYQKSTIAEILGVSCSFVTRHLDSFKKIF